MSKAFFTSLLLSLAIGGERCFLGILPFFLIFVLIYPHVRPVRNIELPRTYRLTDKILMP